MSAIFLSDSERVRALQAQLADVIESRMHTERWYGARIAEMEKLARERGDNGNLTTREIWNLIANGTPSASDPPTFAVQLNTAEWRAQRAETLARQLASACVRMFHADIDPPKSPDEFSPNARLVFSLSESILAGGIT